MWKLDGIWSPFDSFNTVNPSIFYWELQKTQEATLYKQSLLFLVSGGLPCVGKNEMWKLRIFVTLSKADIDCTSLVVNNINATYNGCIHSPTRLRVISRHFGIY